MREIEEEEWQHRRLVGEMLFRLQAPPNRVREARARVVGSVLGLLCHVSGWYAPMYGAGRLESGNIKEYEEAARYALESGHPEHLDCLLDMARVEWEHEHYFRSKVEGHPFTRYLGLWKKPPPKETIGAAQEATQPPDKVA